MSRSTIPCSARPIVDPIVYKFVTSWLSTFPETLNVTLKDFLKIGPFDAATTYGRTFARNHQYLIRRILDNYADSVSLLHIPDEDEYDDVTRCHAFVEGEYDEDARCDSLVEDEYDDDTGRYSLRKQFSNVKLADQRM